MILSRTDTDRPLNISLLQKLTSVEPDTEAFPPDLEESESLTWCSPTPLPDCWPSISPWIPLLDTDGGGRDPEELDPEELDYEVLDSLV